MNKKELRKEIRNRKQQYTQEELKKLSEPIINRLRHHPKLIEAKLLCFTIHCQMKFLHTTL